MPKIYSFRVILFVFLKSHRTFVLLVTSLLIAEINYRGNCQAEKLERNLLITASKFISLIFKGVATK